MNSPRFTSKALWLVAAALSLSLTGCGVSTEFYRGVEIDITRGDYANAVAGVKKNVASYGEKNMVLYDLDLGLLYHLMGSDDSSSTHFFAAEKRIEDLYTRSVSQTAMSFVLNDNVIPYDGEDFERVLINVFLALNYARRGEPDEALVEARKVDLKLKEYSRQYEGKNKYKDDAFVRYLAGALYENDGEINDAFISYRKSFDSYADYATAYGTVAPKFLLDDLVRTATALQFTEEATHFVELGGAPPANDTHGSIVVLAYAGKGPIKIEYRPTVSIPDTAGTIHTFQIALPKFTPRYPGGRTYDVAIRSTRDSVVAARGVTVIGENITAIAQKNLEDRLAMTYLKSGGRALAKFLAAEKAKAEIQKKNDGLINLLGSLAVDLAVGATEQADVRGWRTLPAEIQLMRFRMKPGEYMVSVSASDGGYTLPAERVRVATGKVAFVIADDIR